MGDEPTRSDINYADIYATGVGLQLDRQKTTFDDLNGALTFTVAAIKDYNTEFRKLLRSMPYREFVRYRKNLL